MSQKKSPLEDHRSTVERLIEEGRNNQQIVEFLRATYGVEVTRHSIRRAKKRWGIADTPKPDVSPPGVDIEGDLARLASSISGALDDPEKLMLDRGLNPEEWVIGSMTVNEWDSPTGEVLKQLKLNLQRKKPYLLPEAARVDGDFKRARPRYPSIDSPRLVALVGDHHAPHHEPELHDTILTWLDENKPEQGVILGDLVDFPEISRHRHDPLWAASTQECLDAGYQILREYIEASPDTHWTFIEGNHEARLRNTIIDQAKDLYGLRPGGDEALPAALSMTHLLRLDELGIEYQGAETTYEHTKVKLSKHLAAVHGHVATKHSGSSAKKSLEQYGHSIVQGHSHRASMVFQTIYNIDGEAETLTAAESGCLCRIEGGLGYTVNSDWQQGFVTAIIYPDGKFKLDLATFVGDSLMWRDKRY